MRQHYPGEEPGPYDDNGWREVTRFDVNLAIERNCRERWQHVSCSGRRMSCRLLLSAIPQTQDDETAKQSDVARPQEDLVSNFADVGYERLKVIPWAEMNCEAFVPIRRVIPWWICGSSIHLEFK